MLACVSASPEAVAAHDRAAWLGLFAENAEIHDPVGSRPHAGPAAIACFYDTFIAPNTIHFEVAHELACGDSVARGGETPDEAAIRRRLFYGIANAGEFSPNDVIDRLDSPGTAGCRQM